MQQKTTAGEHVIGLSANVQQGLQAKEPVIGLPTNFQDQPAESVIGLAAGNAIMSSHPFFSYILSICCCSGADCYSEPNNWNKVMIT